MPGSSPHQALLAEVAEEVREAVMRLAGSTGAGPGGGAGAEAGAGALPEVRRCRLTLSHPR